jgi:signal transduction histidine kinase/uncharacterized coiled-coil protein SlyX
MTYNSQVVLKNKTAKRILPRLLLIIFLSIFLTNSGYAQQLSEAQIKSVYLYHFFSYVEWENEPDIDQFVIGFLGEEPEMFDELKNMAATKKAKNKPIKVVKIGLFDTAQKIQMLYVCASENNNMHNIVQLFSGKNILLITNQCDEKTLIMINFVYSEKDKVQFQINKPSIVQENLKLAPKVLLKGGTELDVAELYFKMEEEVFKSKNTILQQQNTLNELNNKLAIQNKEITKRENQLTLVQEKYNDISNSLLLLSREFETKKDALNSKEAEMASLLKSIKEFTDNLNQQKEKIQSIDLEIKEKEKIILKQDKTIQEQSRQINLHQKKEVQQEKTIKSQHYINLIIILVLIFVVIILYQYFLSSKRQKKTNKLISEQNNQLIQTASELIVAKDATEAANKELETFSYSVSHDLRAPLRGIDGFSQILLDEYYDKMDEQGKSYLQRIRAATQRMAQLIDDMLNLSRVSRTEMSISQVNLSEIAQKVVDELRQTQPEREGEFVIHQGIKVRGDSRLLRIVLENLFVNAWKYTSKHASAHIEFGEQQKDGKPVYYIHDDGAGFDMKYAQKLFGAFQRLHTSSEFPGTGIGLATVQRIIHRHGGKVWAEGEVEKGAIFYFTIP